jgi:pimeloyl-ACP methyl ester carboxylesterase
LPTIDFELFDKFLHDSPKGDKYTMERHTVTTEDGYILSLMRIVPKKQEFKTRKPVLLQHGLGSNGLHWLGRSHRREMANPVAMMEEGYDVWLGNNRGSTYSLEHTELSWQGNKYWDFSWAEMGRHDVPANMEYIYNATG